MRKTENIFQTKLMIDEKREKIYFLLTKIYSLKSMFCINRNDYMLQISLKKL